LKDALSNDVRTPQQFFAQLDLPIRTSGLPACLTPKVTLIDPNHATVAFKQTYRADAYRSSGRKTLQMVRQGDRWLIQQETITVR
jgi:hypothetical protein